MIDALVLGPAPDSSEAHDEPPAVGLWMDAQHTWFCLPDKTMQRWPRGGCQKTSQGKIRSRQKSLKLFWGAENIMKVLCTVREAGQGLNWKGIIKLHGGSRKMCDLTVSPGPNIEPPASFLQLKVGNWRLFGAT